MACSTSAGNLTSEHRLWKAWHKEIILKCIDDYVKCIRFWVKDPMAMELCSKGDEP
jgi:hypothetical protein